MNTMPEPIAAQENARRGSCVTELGWFFAGAVLPIGSLAFYRRASQRRVGAAILFFLVFTVLIALLSTTALSTSLLAVGQSIRSQFDSGAIPEITIRGGVAEVSGKQPLIFTNDTAANGAAFYAVDTTGQVTTIDQTRYVQGLLLTRTDLIVLNSGRLQDVPLSEINTMLGTDPIVVNADTATQAWQLFSVLMAVGIFLFLVFWDALLRLMVISVAALVLWGVGGLIQPKIGYGPFIITGLYAIVPAVYLTQLFHVIGVSFPGLQTLLILIFWAAALVGTLVQARFFQLDRPMRLWTAVLGLPLLLLLGVDLFVSVPGLAWKIVLWVVALGTGAALVGLRLYFHVRDQQGQPAVPPVPPAPAA